MTPDLLSPGSEDAHREAVEEDRPIAAASRRRAWLFLAITAAVVIVADVVTKTLAIQHLGNGQDSIRLLGGAVYLTFTRNAGAAFSIGEDLTWVFPIIAIIVCGVIVALARKLASTPWAIAIGLILGGAMGNLADRIFRAPGPFRGHVVDFISVFGDAGERFPVFNVADSALTCGVVLAIILEFTGRRRDGLPATADGS
ncbi:signal peptidase II [Luedemannella helvata]|uniref:Lipoprotein signal peptidase n=1 Tax=Luedemannella helvata TaxID=349315 RepID=A0ABN2JZ19_9ACTN